MMCTPVPSHTLLTPALLSVMDTEYFPETDAYFATSECLEGPRGLLIHHYLRQTQTHNVTRKLAWCNWPLIKRKPECFLNIFLTCFHQIIKKVFCTEQRIIVFMTTWTTDSSVLQQLSPCIDNLGPFEFHYCQISVEKCWQTARYGRDMQAERSAEFSGHWHRSFCSSLLCRKAHEKLKVVQICASCQKTGCLQRSNSNSPSH